MSLGFRPKEAGKRGWEVSLVGGRHGDRDLPRLRLITHAGRADLSFLGLRAHQLRGFVTVLIMRAMALLLSTLMPTGLMPAALVSAALVVVAWTLLLRLQ